MWLILSKPQDWGGGSPSSWTIAQTVKPELEWNGLDQIISIRWNDSALNSYDYVWHLFMCSPANLTGQKLFHKEEWVAISVEVQDDNDKIWKCSRVMTSFSRQCRCLAHYMHLQF